MSTPVISGDGIFSHIFIGAADLQKSVAFYDAALGALSCVGCKSTSLAKMVFSDLSKVRVLGILLALPLFSVH